MPHWLVLTVLAILNVAGIWIVVSLGIYEFRALWNGDKDA